MGKILIAGGTGFVGSSLAVELAMKGYSINVLSRKNSRSENPNINYFQWDIEKEEIEKRAFDDVDTIINLTGANIQKKRWTAKRKVEIIESWVKSIDLLYKYVSENDYPIKAFISSSAVGYYGAVTSQHIFSENDKSGNDFLATVCRKWENAAKHFESKRTRVIILRKGMVIGKCGGFYKKLAPFAKLGINFSLGNGKQYVPWIHIRDLTALYEFILDRPDMNGTFNAVASQQPTMNQISKTFLKCFHKKSILPNVPTFVVKLLSGKKSSMLLKGSRVSNEKIREYGFQFQYDSLDKAIKGL